jgi:hypothetical protein
MQRKVSKYTKACVSLSGQFVSISVRQMRDGFTFKNYDLHISHALKGSSIFFALLCARRDNKKVQQEERERARARSPRYLPSALYNVAY